MICGHCKNHHDTVAEVKACSLTEHTTTKATDKQVKYIADLSNKKAWHVGSTLTDHQRAQVWAARKGTLNLDKKAASELIKAMLALPERMLAADGLSSSTEVVRTQEAKAEARYAAPEGIYFHDGDYYKVVQAVNGSGRLYARRCDKGTGKFSHYATGMVYELTESERVTAEQAKAFGDLYGMCMICGRTLTDDDSIARGIGPICAGKMGWL